MKTTISKVKFSCLAGGSKKANSHALILHLHTTTTILPPLPPSPLPSSPLTPLHPTSPHLSSPHATHPPAPTQPTPDASRVERRCKTARLKHVDPGVRKELLTGETIFLKGLECGHSNAVVCAESSGLCFLFVLPILVLALPVLAVQSSDGHVPKLVEAFRVPSLLVREAEMEARETMVEDVVDQTVLVPAPVAALVTSSCALLFCFGVQHAQCSGRIQS